MQRFEKQDEYYEQLLNLNRVAKVVKGGRRFSFSAIAVAGDQHGGVGLGKGKANTATLAIRKSIDKAKQNIHKVNLKENTIPHEIQKKFSGAKILLKPATPGTGLIAGGIVRTVLEAAGVKDILSKSLGSNCKVNIARATMSCLDSLKLYEDRKKELAGTVE